MKPLQLSKFHFFDKNSIISQSPLLIEIGAYSGNLINNFLNSYPNGNAIVYEACSDNFKSLNNAVVDDKRIKTVNKALARKNGQTKLNIYNHRDSHSIYDRSCDGKKLGKQENVTCVTFDQLVKDEGSAHIDCLLINCEGAEIPILESILDNGLECMIDQICVSFHCKHSKIHDVSTVDNILKRLSVKYDIVAGNKECEWYLLIKKLKSYDFWEAEHRKRDSYYITDPSLDELLSDLVMHKNSINDKDILIIGVGGGRLYKELSKKARSISSLDISTEALSSVSKYGKIYTPETLHELPTESIDYATSRLVAQHMSDEDLTNQLKHVFRSLRPTDSHCSLAIHFAGDNSRNDRDEDPHNILIGGRCRSMQLVNKIISEAGGQVTGDQVIRRGSGSNWSGSNWYWFTTHAIKSINRPPVPKKIFFYWGNPVMSWLRYMTLYSFRKFNPDWEMELHVSHIDKKDKSWNGYEAQDFHSYKGKNYLPEVEKLGIKIKECPVFADGACASQNSNFFKWNELAANGGIYSDMDILFVKPIEEYYNNIKDLKTGISYSTDIVHPGHGGHYSIGFMFSSGENMFFKDIFNFSMEHYDLKSYQGAGVDVLYKMLERNQGMKPYGNGLSYIPMDIVYPWRHYQQRDFFHSCHTELPEETIGIHWYAGHPEAQEFNNNISPDTLCDYNNTMSYWLEAVLNQ